MSNLKEDQKQYKEMSFEVIEDGTEFTLENQDGSIGNITEDDILRYIEYMVCDADQFVTLTAPTAIENIRFVQATLGNGEIEVQIGVVKEKRCHMFYKMCKGKECKEIFLAYFHGKFIANMEEYEPVLFM